MRGAIEAVFLVIKAAGDHVIVVSGAAASPYRSPSLPSTALLTPVSYFLEPRTKMRVFLEGRIWKFSLCTHCAQTLINWSGAISRFIFQIFANTKNQNGKQKDIIEASFDVFLRLSLDFAIFFQIIQFLFCRAAQDAHLPAGAPGPR